MSSSQSSGSAGVPIAEHNLTAPTPVNTPLNNAPISSGAGLSRPTVPDISEEADEDVEEGAGGSSLGGPLTEALQSMVQGKLSTLIGRSSGYIESLPIDVRRNVEALKGIQVHQVELQNQYKKECFELEKKVCASAPLCPFSMYEETSSCRFTCMIPRSFYGLWQSISQARWCFHRWLSLSRRFVAVVLDDFPFLSFLLIYPGESLLTPFVVPSTSLSSNPYSSAGIN